LSRKANSRPKIVLARPFYSFESWLGEPFSHTQRCSYLAENSYFSLTALATKKIGLQKIHVAIARFFFFCRVVGDQNRGGAIRVIAVGKADLYVLGLNPSKAVNQKLWF
jgi:hypothetical protein